MVRLRTALFVLVALASAACAAWQPNEASPAGATAWLDALQDLQTSP